VVHHCVRINLKYHERKLTMYCTGRDEQFLNDLRDHAMSIFAGAMLINASPKPLKPITGFLVGSNCWYLRRKAMKGCLPFVEERLNKTAEYKADAKCGWTPPVSLLLCSTKMRKNKY
jgi:hypothetical protein